MAAPGGAARLLWSLLRRDRPSTPYGAGRGDAVRLADSPPLRHLARALDGGEARTAGSLYTQPIELIAAPDPTDWLRATARENPPPGAVPLRVLSWNLALLDVRVGPWTYRQSPGVQARRGPVLDRVLADGADLVLLQELWHDRDQQALAARAPAAGYRLACPPRGWVDGLAVLVKEEQVEGPLEVEVRPYPFQDRLEALVLPRKETFLRSWLRCSFRHPRLGPLTVYDTHLAPYPASWRQRLCQGRELGLDVAARPAEELVLVGGDLNAGAFYGRQTWRTPDGGIQHGWWHDALSLPVLQHYGGLVDLAIRGRALAEADLEVRLGRALVNDPARAAQAPPGCDEAHRRAYTATDCNALYFRQYAGTEQPARLDHLLARDPTGRVHVAASRHRYTARDLLLDGELVEPSDHYGVEVELRVG